jgi:hypothetical protein
MDVDSAADAPPVEHGACTALSAIAGHSVHSTGTARKTVASTTTSATESTLTVLRNTRGS